MKVSVSLIFISICTLIFFSCAEEKSDDPAEDKSTDKLIISGTLVLSPDITDDPDIAASGPIPEGVVFIKGFDATAETDSNGAFKLEIPYDEDTANLTEDDSPEYSVVLWKTTSAGNRYGIQKDSVPLVKNEGYDLGKVELTHTFGVYFFLEDENKNPIENFYNDCSISFDGYGDKIKVVNKNNEKLASSYMPAAEYTVNVQCPGYENKTEVLDYSELQPTKNKWVNRTISLTSQEN